MKCFLCLFRSEASNDTNISMWPCSDLSSFQGVVSLFVCYYIRTTLVLIRRSRKVIFGNETRYFGSKVPVIFSCDLGTLSGGFCHIVILKCISDLYIQASWSLASFGKTSTVLKLDRYVCCLCNVVCIHGRSLALWGPPLPSCSVIMVII